MPPCLLVQTRGRASDDHLTVDVQESLETMGRLGFRQSVELIPPRNIA